MNLVNYTFLRTLGGVIWKFHFSVNFGRYRPKRFAAGFRRTHGQGYPWFPAATDFGNSSYVRGARDAFGETAIQS